MGNGVLVTARHLLTGQDIMVACGEGKTSRAEVLKTEPRLDLAVLQLDGGDCGGLPALPLRMVPAEIGETVFAIGAPFGLMDSATVGIISAVKRTLPRTLNANLLVDTSITMIQTDAALNPGNSGGPLLDAEGWIVGMVIAVLPAAQRIGFALPSKHLQDVVSQRR